MSGLEDIFHPRGGSSADGDDLPGDPVSGGQSGPFVGTVAEDAVDGELVNVTLGAQDDTHDVPAKWVAQGDSMPATGDDALVVFDDEGDAWLVAWGTMDPATSGGVTDHGALTGLADDDHAQYHNDTRGDARYYTQSQLDTALALKAPLASPALTGTPAAPTAAPGTNTTQLSTTAFVQSALGAYLTTAAAASTYAPLASPALTGTPTAPTAAQATNTTQIATTAHVKLQRIHDFAVPTAATPMNGNKFTGLAAGSGAGDSVRYEQVLLLAGGTMSGAIAMGSNKVTGLAAGTTNGDALRYEQVIGVYLTTAAAAAAYQPLDTDLTTIAGLTATTDNFMQSKAGAWASRTVAQVVTDLVAGGLLTAATAASTYQPVDADLTAIAGLTATTDNFLQAKSSAWASRTPAQVSTDLQAAGLAPKASPALTGTPTVPTATPLTNNTQAASTAYVDAAVAVVGGSPAASTVTFTPAAGIAATNVQAAIEEAVADWQATFDTLNIGKLFDFAGTEATVPTKHVLAYGQNLSRTTYAAAYAVLCPVVPGGSAATATASNDRITTGSAHGLVIGDRVFLETIGAGAAGLAVNTEYYVRTVPSTTTITVATSQTVSAITGGVTVAGADLNITSDGTGLVLRAAPHGIGSSTTFKAPDLRERTTVGKGDMGATGSDRGTTNFAWANVLGLDAGEAAHAITIAELAVHTHIQDAHTHVLKDFASGDAAVAGAVRGTNNGASNSNALSATTATNQNTGSGTAHNNVSPSVMVNKIMYVGV